MKTFKKLALMVLISGLLPLSQRAQATENPNFSRTHLLPSTATLPSGVLVFGTDVAYGVTDFLQVGTNLVSDFYQFFNANAKVSLVDYQAFALAVTCGWNRYNYQTIDSTNPDLEVQSWLPGVVAAFELAEPLAWFVGANLNYTSATLQTEGVQRSGYMQGASVGSDLSLSYNSLFGNKGSGGSNALAVGVSYDLSYKMPGVGISHHWPGFHLGVHYYFGADRYALRPIIAGGGVVNF